MEEAYHRQLWEHPEGGNPRMEYADRRRWEFPEDEMGPMTEQDRARYIARNGAEAVPNARPIDLIRAAGYAASERDIGRALQLVGRLTNPFMDMLQPLHSDIINRMFSFHYNPLNPLRTVGNIGFQLSAERFLQQMNLRRGVVNPVNEAAQAEQVARTNFEGLMRETQLEVARQRCRSD
jgi:hypothetical protein